MTRFLVELVSKDYFVSVWNSLPIAGVDGTLRSRMKNSIAEGVLRGKTGTLTGQYNLAGYVPQFDSEDKIDHYAPYAMLTQTSSKYSGVARQVQNEAGIRMTELSKTSKHY